MLLERELGYRYRHPVPGRTPQQKKERGAVILLCVYRDINLSLCVEIRTEGRYCQRPAVGTGAPRCSRGAGAAPRTVAHQRDPENRKRKKQTSASAGTSTSVACFDGTGS